MGTYTYANMLILNAARACGALLDKLVKTVEPKDHTKKDFYQSCPCFVRFQYSFPFAELEKNWFKKPGLPTMSY